VRCTASIFRPWIAFISYLEVVPTAARVIRI
jgi:hypothetical protein